MTLSDLWRFVSFVSAQPSGCWNWVGHVDKSGYGRFFWHKRLGKPHRFAYEFGAFCVNVDMCLSEQQMGSASVVNVNEKTRENVITATS